MRGYYHDFIVLVFCLWLMLMSTLIFLSSFAQKLAPILHAVGEVRGTLGFYFLTVWFLYALLPFLVSMNSELSATHKETFKEFSQFAAMVFMFYFGGKALIAQAQEKLKTPHD